MLSSGYKRNASVCDVDFCGLGREYLRRYISAWSYALVVLWWSYTMEAS